MLHGNNCIIANGRLGLDKDVGDFKFYGEKGCSVVDYLLLPLTDFETISNFKICDVTEFSDHAGISYGLKCKSRTSSTYDHIPKRTFSRQLKWNNDTIEEYRNSISNLSEIFQSLSLSLEHDSSENNINEVLVKFSDSVYSCADKYFGKNICTDNFSTSIRENKWFDEECHSAKTDFMSVCDVYDGVFLCCPFSHEVSRMRS